MISQFVELTRADNGKSLLVRASSIIAVEPVDLPEHPYVRIRLTSGQEYILLDECSELINRLDVAASGPK